MARPRKEGMEYFPHDTDARNDLKIRKLRAVFGNDGYATYFILLENIYRNKCYELDISDAETKLILAEECRISEEKFTQIYLKCIDLDLFSKEEYEKREILTSEAIKKRTEPIENKRKKNNEHYNNNRKEVSDAETNAETDISDVEKGTESTQRKEKNSKEKNSKVNNIISPKFSDEQIELILSKELFSLMKINNPNVKEPNFQTWAKHIDLMIRIDKRSVEDIRSVMIFCQNDNFWKANILSTSKLREKFDQLMIRAGSNKKQINNDWKRGLLENAK